MPIRITDTVANRVLTRRADGFLLWLGFSVDGGGSATIPGVAPNGLLAFTYDASNNGGAGLAQPVPGTRTYEFSDGANTLTVGEASLETLVASGTSVNRRVTAVFNLQAPLIAGVPTVNGWLGNAWLANGPAGGYPPLWDPAGQLGFTHQTVSWGNRPRFANRVSQSMRGGLVHALGVIAPLLAGPMIQSFYKSVNGQPIGGPSANPCPGLAIQVDGQPAWTITCSGASGYAMICHGILAPGRFDPWPWQEWLAPDPAALAQQIEHDANRADWNALVVPNDEPQEIIYLQGLGGQGAGPVPTI